MLQIGQYNLLRVLKQSPIGLYLGTGNEEVLLPKKYIPEGIKIGDELELFVYLDNENRPIATTLKPYATEGEFAFMMVKDINEHGAFLDWGIPKDLFVAYSEQRVEMQKGNKYIVFLFLDEYSGRIAATTKWGKFLDNSNANFRVGDEVQLLIAEQTDLGFKAIINNMCEGLLYENEIFEELRTGDVKRGFIKQKRDDGKIDLRLQQPGYDHIVSTKHIILEQLKAHGGLLPLGDKSSPEEIYKLLKISKKAFKKTIGGLFKERLILIRDLEIRLIDQLED